MKRPRSPREAGRRARFIAFALPFLPVAALAQTPGWSLTREAAGSAITLGFESDVAHYRFTCTHDDVVVADLGVTKLLDLQTNQPVGDDKDAHITPGASVMALSTGKGQPDFVPASAAKSRVSGWDLSIHLAKGDRQLATLPRAKMISLFTTGETVAVPLEQGDRALFANFLRQCGGL